MTIGGNDSGVFISAIVAVRRRRLSTLGQGSPCKDQYGSSFEDTIRDHDLPGAREGAAGRPRQGADGQGRDPRLPVDHAGDGGCFTQMPVAEGDVPYLRGIQATLNDAVRRAAAATGATYVDLNAVSEGHDACQPIGVRWVEPVLPGPTRSSCTRTRWASPRWPPRRSAAFTWAEV